MLCRWDFDIDLGWLDGDDLPLGNWVCCSVKGLYLVRGDLRNSLCCISESFPHVVYDLSIE